nr:glycoside hydrolase family 172 protein [Gayadomonas joobiniege]
MVDRSAIAQYPTHDFRLKQESSYNRGSVSPDEPEGWFLNHDFNSNAKDANFIRTEINDGRKEWVLMDAKGPGVLVRTWMPWQNDKKPTTDSIIRFYFDGESEPEYEGNMFSLLDGSGDIPYPLAHKSLRSAVSFFPMPYAKGLKVTVSERPFFYQLTYREYSSETKIKSFKRSDLVHAKPLINQVAHELLYPNNNTDGKPVKLSGTLAPGGEKSLSLPKGMAAINALALQLGDYSNKNITRSIVVKMDFDGQQTVQTPISEFFGTGVGLNPFTGWYRTVSESGLLSSRWVMPYQRTASISLLNLSEQAVDFELTAQVGDWQWDDNSLYFHAIWRGQYPVATRPFSDWNYVNLTGRGVYVGDTLTIWNPIARWWGEGDEKIFVDGETFPSIFGTGTEDYYGYSWGGKSTDFYQHPFHAQPFSHQYNKLNRKTGDERNTQGYSTETRTRALDTMPFASSLKLDMEVWHWEEVDMGFAVGAYWYGDLTTRHQGSSNAKDALKHSQTEVR